MTIEVNANPVPGAAVMLARQAVLVIGGAVAGFALLQHRNFSGFAAWVQSDNAIPAITALGTAATAVWGQIALFRKKSEAVIMATAADNSVAVVVNQKPTV